MTWNFYNIQENNIAFFTYRCYPPKPEPARSEYKEYNVWSSYYQEPIGIRLDACENFYEHIKTIANKNKDKNFLIILDQGEHYFGDTPNNLFVFNRKFHSGHYNFHNSYPPTLIEQKKQWLFCPMGRASVIRTYIFDLLVSKNLHKDNSVSYLCTNFPERKPDRDEYFKTGGVKNAHMLPYNNFENEILSNDQRHNSWNWSAHNNCLFGITVLNGATENVAWYDQRVYNVLAGGLVPVIISGTMGMGQLENMGFVVPDYINWRLCDLWPVDRYNTGLDKMELLIDGVHNFIGQNRLEDISKDWYPYAVKNQTHMINTMKQQALLEEQHICKWICTITKNLANPKYQQLMP